MSHSPGANPFFANSQNRDLWAGFAIFLAALSIRLLYLYESSDNPTFALPIVDSFEYHRLARDLADGKGFDKTFFWQPFLYPFLLAGIYYVTHASIVCAKILQVVLGCFTCLVTYYLGNKAFGRRTGLIAAGFTAVYGPLIFFDGELLSTGLDAFWPGILILLLLATRNEGHRNACFLAGLCGALAVLTRPTFLPFVAGATLWLLVGWSREKGAARMVKTRLALYVAGFMLIAIPVAMLNVRVTGHLGIVPSSGGINFYIGNNPDRCRTLSLRPGWQWNDLVELPRRHGAADSWEGSKYFMNVVEEYALTQPASFLKGLAQKTVEFFGAREIPRNLDIYLFRKWSAVLSACVWKVGRFGFPFGVLLPLAAIGILLSWRRIPGPMYIFLVVYPMSVILVFVSDRYRIPLIPPLAVLGAEGCVRTVEVIRQRNWRKFLAASIAGVSALLFSVLPGPFCGEMVDLEPELYYLIGATSANLGKDDVASAYLAEAIRRKADNVDALSAYGALLARNGSPERALDYLGEALRIKPDFAQAHYNLGIALAKMGRFQDAIRHYRSVVALVPYDAQAHNQLGLALAMTGAMEDASDHFYEAIRLKPPYVEALNNLGVLLARTGRRQEAIPFFEAALRSNPEDTDSRYNLGYAFLQLGRFDEAEAQYREVVRRNPADASALRILQSIRKSKTGSSPKGGAGSTTSQGP